MSGTLITGKILNIDYNRIKVKFDAKIPHDEQDDFPLEKARLRLIPIFSVLQCASILCFGWSIEFQVHISVPIISTFVTGWTAVSTQSVIMTYLVDAFPDRSAAASAALNLARCEFAAGGTSFIMPMVNGLGAGLAFTVCAIIQIVALLGVALQWRLGHHWRKEAEQQRQTQL